jgi:hypothetical protein
MIAVVLLLLIVLLLAVTPWRPLPMAGRLWAVAALLNALVFFGMPTTPATSAWRPVVSRVLAASAATKPCARRARLDTAATLRHIRRDPRCMGGADNSRRATRCPLHLFLARWAVVLSWGKQPNRNEGLCGRITIYQ